MLDVVISNMKNEDYEAVVKIFFQGINSEFATFQTSVPSFEEWDNAYCKCCRFVAQIEEKVVGWIGILPTSNLSFYRGVAEVSVYVDTDYCGAGIGKQLLNKLIYASEEEGFWTLEAKVLKENIGSIKLHEKFGFRVVGIREKFAKKTTGVWHDVVILERRSIAVVMINVLFLK